MGIFEALKNGFTRVAKLMNVVLIFFIFNLVMGLVNLPLASPENAGKPAVAAALILISFVFFLAFIFLQGGMMGLVKDQLKTGSSSIAQFTGYGKKFYLRILGLLLIYLLIAIGVVLVLSLMSAGVLLLGRNVVTRSLVAALITVVALGIITFLVYPVYSIVVEDNGPIAAFKRGINVSKRHFWKTLGLFLSMLLVSLVISLIIGFITGVVGISFGDTAKRVLLVIANSVLQAFIPVIMVIAFMGFYMSLILEGGASQEETQGPGETPQL